MLESLITIPHIYYFFSCHYIFWPVNCTPEKYAILRQKMHQNNDMSWLIWTVLITLNHARNSIDQIEGFDASLLLIAVLGRAVLATCGNYGLRRGIVINSGSVIIIKSHIHSQSAISLDLVLFKIVAAMNWDPCIVLHLRFQITTSAI